MTEKADIVGALGARTCKKCGELLTDDNLTRCDTCVGTARDVVEEAIYAGVMWTSARKARAMEPGGVIASLSPEKRRVLEALKAEDLNDMRDDHYKAFAQK